MWILFFRKYEFNINKFLFIRRNVAKRGATWRGEEATMYLWGELNETFELYMIIGALKLYRHGI